MPLKKQIILVIILLYGCLNAIANNAIYHTVVMRPDEIKSLRIRYANLIDIRSNRVKPERPFLVLRDGVVDNSDPGNQLEISFDEMSHGVHQYTYTIKHLNSDWRESNLISSDYIQGFTTQDITTYEHSLNTSINYTHYSFVFPNDEMMLSASGNYAIQIYEDGDMDKTIAYACFSVVEPKVAISAKTISQTDIEYNGRYQQLNIDIQVKQRDNGSTSSITDNYWIVVRQNGRLDNQVVRPKPTYVEPMRLRYIHQKELIFEGGNEYRRFDSYSTYFAGEHIERIARDHSDYHVLLNTDALRGQGAIYSGSIVSDKCGIPYINEPDADGQMVINAERVLYDIDTEAEYMYIHWTLKSEKPMENGHVYVAGDLFENVYGSRNRMFYDPDEKCYFLTALMKQGGYDYQYHVLGAMETQATLLKTEGSHWETENEYTIYVYYRPFGSRYDQLVGLQTLRSSY